VVEKVKLSLHAIQALRGREATAPTILDFGTRWGISGKRHAPAAIYHRERAPGTHRIRGCVGLRPDLDAEAREKNPLPLSGIEPR
jgi:hypothetical protein